MDTRSRYMLSIAKDTSRFLHKGMLKFTKKIDLSLHYHSEIELIYLPKGELNIHLNDDRIMHLDQGDIAIIKALDLHRLEPLNDDNNYLLVILPSHLSLKITSEHIDSRKFSKDEISMDALKVLRMHKTFSSLSNNYKDIYFELMTEVVMELYNLKFGEPSTFPAKILSYIHEHYRDKITLDSIATQCNTNRTYVSKMVNSFTGYSFNNYLNKLRLSYFMENITDPEAASIIEVAQNAGFTSPRTFYRTFMQEVGFSPSEYLKKNEGLK